MASRPSRSCRRVLLAEFRLGPLRLIDELSVLFLIVRIAYVFHLSWQPPGAALDPLVDRLCDQHRDFLLRR